MRRRYLGWAAAAVLGVGNFGSAAFAQPQYSPMSRRSAQAGYDAGAPAGRNVVNILAMLPQTSPDTDYTRAINSALAAGKTIYLPNTGKPYIVSDAIRFSVAGSGLTGQRGTTIAFTDRHTVFSIRAPNITLTNITFDGRALGSVAKPESYCISPNFRWTGGGMYYGGPLFLQQGCDNAVITHIEYKFSSSSAITLQSNNVTVAGCEFENNVGFGINAAKGASNFHFIGNWTNGNGLELIGVSHGAETGEITNNRAIGAGDDCFSISGDHVRVTGNLAKRCLAHGIGVFGDGNVITGNTVVDNGQDDNPAAPPVALWNGTSKPIYHSPGYSPGTYDGIKLIGAFGGNGTQNVISNNTVDDDQREPTQGGIEVRSAAGNNVSSNAVRRQK
jgi:hypothetical protein